ncbi:MAG: hypothetical protein AB7D38_10795 [Sulfurimonas sp.]
MVTPLLVCNYTIVLWTLDCRASLAMTEEEIAASALPPRNDGEASLAMT